MKKTFLLSLTLLLASFSANAFVGVCDSVPDENGHFNCPYIKSGSITWNETSKTLTLDNAVIEYNTSNVYDGVRPISITEDATIVVHGTCKLLTNAFSALYLFSYDVKNISITGDGSLQTSSSWIDIYLYCTRLTIKDINLETVNGIANNGFGEWCALTFDHVQANIKGNVERFGEGISFKNCAITYPSDAYIAHDQYEDTDYGYFIANGDGSAADHIIISRGSGNIPGDVNGDGEVNIADVNAVIDVILGGSSNPSADVNQDGEINIADVNAVIDIIFGGGPAQNNHEYVDLGLPSGTLWATCNIGASKPEDYGDYFAWGETAPKAIYTWETYKWCNGTNDTMTKYCINSSCGTVDNKTELELEDDAAYANWGPSWRMPSTEQCQELCESCTWQQTTRNGVNGQLVTGPNGQSMFLPAAGERYNNNIGDLGSYGQFWSRTLYDDIIHSYSAFFLFFYLDDHKGYYGNERYIGFPVRAVRMSQN